MIYTTHYKSPIGDILLAAKNNKLIGLWIEDQKYFLSNIKEEMHENNNYNIFIDVKKWLDRYFNNEKPSIKELDLDPIGSEFQKEVWKILIEIPYGSVITYNDIAKRIATERGIKRMSAQAVGGAVGHNPISIIIPCHRVVGSNNSLVGYAGGINLKYALLKQEGIPVDDYKIPTKGTSL